MSGSAACNTTEPSSKTRPPVHHRLAVHDDPHVVVSDAEEVVGLDHLEPLVHHRGRVYGDLAPHPPRRMLERVLRPDPSKPRLLQTEEGSPRRRHQNLPYLRPSSPLQTLEDRRVLRVYRYYAVIVRQAHNPLAAGDEGFFVGEGDAVSRPQGGHGCGEASEADYTVQDDVGWRLRELDCGAGPGEDFGREVREPVPWLPGRRTRVRTRRPGGQSVSASRDAERPTTSNRSGYLRTTSRA